MDEPASEAQAQAPKRPSLGLLSGMGLVIGNMVGVGVLTSTGFMASDLGPWPILAAWAIGGLAAICGARAYAALAALIPRSGGEYRYLSDLLHPSVGYLAGWTSLLVGFSAPIAVAAATAGSFAETLAPWLPARFIGAGTIVLLTLFHALDLRMSKVMQNLFAAAKVLLLIGFVAIGLYSGSHTWPTWRPPVAHLRFPLESFMISLVYIAYAYSGWNTAIYAAEEFRQPKRTVPRAMMLGTLLVAVFYLLVNWVFVANLAPDRLAAWAHGDTSRVTIGHLLVSDLAGAFAAKVMSAVVILSLFSSMSSMTLVGPRICRSMAREGYLPRLFAGSADKPPTGSVLFQSGLALILLLTHSFELLMRNVGSILTLTSVLTVLALFRVQFGTTKYEKPGAIPLVAASIFVLLSAWMLYFAFKSSPTTIAWVAVTAAIAFTAWFLSTRRRTRRA